jgi:hypothetical protein
LRRAIISLGPALASVKSASGEALLGSAGTRRCGGRRENLLKNTGDAAAGISVQSGARFTYAGVTYRVRVPAAQEPLQE